MAPSLDLVVTAVATQLMAADTNTAAALSQCILHDLVAVFDVDASFLRHNDHDARVTKLVAEWPPRHDIPDPDPLGDVAFENADPVFAILEHLTEPIVIRPDPITEEYGDRVERANGIPVISITTAPLLAHGVTTGALGFIKFDDRDWTTEELNAVQAIASMFAQLQGRLIAEDRLRFLADHDDLTNLYNRRALIGHLDGRLGAGQPGPVSVLLLDLDRLKTLNDYLGHGSGDKFIQVAAERLRDSLGDSCVVGRLGGDEFVVIPVKPMDTDDAETLADRLRHEVNGGVAVGGEVIKRTVSIGVATGAPGIDSASEVIQRADEALLDAKKAGGDRITVYSQEMFARQSLRTDVELHLQQGIEDDALTLHYLPEVDLRTGQILAVEALVRWLHPTRGLLSPDAFIGVAESINLAGELGRWVLRTACAQWAEWRAEGVHPSLTLRVNVSPAQLVTANFADEVSHILDEFLMPAPALCLEITESVFQDVEVTRKGLLAVQDLGVKLAIDDFGTGYSSLAYLKSLPVDTIKIDKGFVLRLAEDEGDRAIVRSTIGLAEAFQLEVVAEGVETTTAADLLLQYGCHRAQGFLLSRPIDRVAAKALLKHGRIDDWPPK
ncbi:sensor domain-containing phosphodiesterase [Mycobacterium sp. CPCC 205372]|uniref:Sensor domain-containing phosphodiesterase n=1 Tax=Mycobacterium hippophais TaxID=3016340 RepID=A0ABT4PMD3_9MYCO|nr:sensor domain-containing phosphodiesterase [Mycobacterium hippophais]MCZ8377720.1 sensor domain-containing phosphodiesterase [Mycobacterium hippophais]